jgi:hypothetical protein
MGSFGVTRDLFELVRHVGDNGNEGGPRFDDGENLRYYILRDRNDPSKDEHVDVRVVTSYLHPKFDDGTIWWNRRYLVISLNGRVHDVDRLSLERP